MPLYPWVCTVCGFAHDALRSLADYERPPEREEYHFAACTTPTMMHEWERQVAGNQKVVRGPGWQGGKGNWILWLLLGSSLSGKLPNIDFSVPSGGKCGSAVVIENTKTIPLTAGADFGLLNPGWISPRSCEIWDPVQKDI
jgi:hypothetical protein